MIVTVQGTVKGLNHASKLIAALSVLGYTKDQKKTLILQFVNKIDDSVENLILGQTLRNESLVDDATVPDVSIGMDPLIAKIRNYDKDTFSSTTKALVTTKKTNLFDIAYVSRKESFVEELLSKEKDLRTNSGDDDVTGIVENVLRGAQEVYDIVYVLLPSDSKELSEEILEYADVSIVCVRQGRAEKYYSNDKSNARRYICVTDFDFGSSYNSKLIAKMYGMPTAFGLLHNVGFKDATIDGTVLEWINRNKTAQKSDPAYDFVHNVDLLYNTIIGAKNKKAKDIDFETEMEKFVKEPTIERIWQPIREYPVYTVKKTGKFRTTTDEVITLVPELDTDEETNN